MVKNKKLFIVTILILYTFSLLASCKASDYSVSPSPITTPTPTEIVSGSSPFGTSMAGLSPVEVVTKYLSAKKDNDSKALFDTLADGYNYNDFKVLGVTCLTIVEKKGETNPAYMKGILEGDLAKKHGWTEDNIAFVYAVYDVQYDNKLVPNDSGRMEDVLTLLRMDKSSPWLIKDWGHARFEHKD